MLALPGFSFQKMPAVLAHRVRPMHGGLAGSAIVFREIEAGAVLENCRALIDQIDARLSAEEPFVNVSSAAELLLYLELAASALKETRQIPDTPKLTWH
jgi:hypothetical protein